MRDAQLVVFNHPAATDMYTLSLHAALPIAPSCASRICSRWCARSDCSARSEEHTSKLQSHSDLVCRLLLEKKKHNNTKCMSGTDEIAPCSSHRHIHDG